MAGVKDTFASLYPVYFILSLSFMTDVPFVAMVTWFFAALVRALKRHSSRALAAAVLFACLAVAIDASAPR